MNHSAPSSSKGLKSERVTLKSTGATKPWLKEQEKSSVVESSPFIKGGSTHAKSTWAVSSWKASNTKQSLNESNNKSPSVAASVKSMQKSFIPKAADTVTSPALSKTSATSKAWKPTKVSSSDLEASKIKSTLGTQKSNITTSKLRITAPLSPTKNATLSPTRKASLSPTKKAVLSPPQKSGGSLKKPLTTATGSANFTKTKPTFPSASPHSHSKSTETKSPLATKSPAWKKKKSLSANEKSSAPTAAKQPTVARPPKNHSDGLTQQVLKAEAPDVVLTRAAVGKLQDPSLAPQVESLVDRIQAAGGFPHRRRLSLRNNDLVTTMERVILNDPTVDSVDIDNDPRFAHLQKSLILDFAEGLRTNLHVKRLAIQGVELDNNFLSTLATSLESNFTLETIILCNNAFTSDALVEFCQAMSENETLKVGDLRNQLSPILTTADETVVACLESNRSLQDFQVDVKSPSVATSIQTFVSRNKQHPVSIQTDKKLLDHLTSEALRAEELLEHRKQAAKILEVSTDDDWEYLYELSQRANKYKLATLMEEDTATSNEASGMDVSNHFSQCRKSAQDVLGPAVTLTSDGSFLTDEFISSYLVEEEECGSLTFAFQAQVKLFKRFPIGDPKRKLISEMFADALVQHPRSNEITHINMANCGCGDEWLVRLCERSLEDPSRLPNLHLLNMETNYVSTSGVVALSQCLASPKTWRYLQAVKLENQRHLISSKAELELAKALCLNRSVIRFSLRVRNLWERDQVNKFVSRNTDFLRQARLHHATKTGTLVQRARNKIEQLFDSIAANDASISEVDLVGNQLFLSLPRDEVVKAARSFGTNTHVKTVRMTMLRLDDEFACVLAKSIECNSTIEKLVLDSNMIGSEGILAIVGSLSTNSSIVELQLRHQSKPLGSAEEDQLPGLIASNNVICKLGVDLRGMLPQTELERKLAQNRDVARKNRHKDGTGPALSAAAVKLPKGQMQQFFEKVAANDPSVTVVEIVGDKLFLTLKPDDRLAAARSLAGNTHVTSVRMTMVGLDDAFARELAISLRDNTTVTKVVLDSNAIGSDGIQALVGALGQNQTVSEFQIRHQSKPMPTADEGRMVELLGNNDTLVKLGIDLRNPQVQRDLENKLSKNRDRQRQVRRSRSFDS